MRAAVAFAVTSWFTPVFAVGVHAFGASFALSLLIGLALAASVAALTASPLADLLRALRAAPALLALTAILAVAAVAQIAKISVYMADPSRTDCSFSTEPWRVQHSCMTAYAEAIRFARAGDTNIYDVSLYEPRFVGPLKVDSYHYPPVFLLLPAAVHALRADLFGMRAIWFVLQCVALAAAIFGLARWVGGRPGACAAAGGVFALATPQIVYSLQQGNVQSTAIPLAAIAFVLILRGRFAAGAPLLAYTAAAKIFPAALVLYLLGARRWRALAWVAGSGVLLVALTVAVVGTRPLRDFVQYEIPRISNGDAFPQAERADTTKVNLSVYGLTTRTRQLGATFLDRRRGLAIASGYGLLIIALAVLAGWKQRLDLADPLQRLRLVQLSIGLLALASFRSPFVGFYGFVAPVWLMSLLAAESQQSSAIIVSWIGIAVFGIGHLLVPAPGTPSTPLALAGSGLLFAIALAVSVAAVLRAMRTSPRTVVAAAPVMVSPA